MAKGYHITSKVEFPKKNGGNYIAGARFNRNNSSFQLVFKDGLRILKKTNIGNKAAFLGYLFRKFASGRTGITEKMIVGAIAYLIRNKNDSDSKEIWDFEE